MRHPPPVMKRILSALTLSLLVSCGGSQNGTTTSGSTTTPQAEADAFLAYYNPILVALYTETVRAAWVASTDVSEQHTGLRTGAETAFSAFAGNADIIRRARALLEHEEDLEPITVRI